jgi:hypothetical protein
MGDSGVACFGRGASFGGVSWESIQTWLEERPRAQLALQTLSYVLLFLVLILMYGRGDFSTPPFVYQEF